jgi:GT2 family glycosyltransferase
VSSISVVVPTVSGREDALGRCLAGLRAQSRPPDEVCVVRGRSGPVAALRAGWAATSGDWVAVLDDDAIPRADWLERIERHLLDERLGAVGGRIVNTVDSGAPAARYAPGPVAALSWFGRTTSRLHEVPVRPLIREASFLPGSNICIRRGALTAIDPGLDFGMAPGFELGLCLRLRRSGWRVRFDSEIVVEHRPAARPASRARGDETRYAFEYSRMLAYVLLRELPWPRKVAFAVYFALVGQWWSPGLLLSPAFLVDPRRRRLLTAAYRGKWQGLKVTCASRS